jgi:aminotransferase
LEVDPDRQVVVACGATECMMAAMLAVVDPGDEVIVLEPFYENYGPDGILCGATPRYVPLVEPDWRVDRDALRRAFSSKTKVLVLNTPNNPTGRVFRREELEAIAELCVEWDVLVLTDEIYEYITYDAPHVPIATLPGMADRTVTISGASKTYSVTGWRVGWAIAPPDIADGIKKAHDFLTVGAPHPLQEAIAEALRLPATYYQDLAAMYRRKRDQMVAGLRELGFRLTAPEGAYYIMADIRDVTAMDDVAFARWLVRYGGVAVVPGSSFYADPARGRTKVRFNFCKQDATLEEALRRLRESLRQVPS